MPITSGFVAAEDCERACAPPTDVAASAVAIPIASPMRVLVTVILLRIQLYESDRQTIGDYTDGLWRRQVERNGIARRARVV
jgi:hypothetical protein